MTGLTCVEINGRGKEKTKWTDGKKGEIKEKARTVTFKEKAKVLKLGAEDELQRNGGGESGGTERVNLEFSEAEQGMKHQVVFEQQRI